MSNWEIAVAAVVGFVLFFTLVFTLVAWLGWRGLSWRDDDDDEPGQSPLR